MSRFELRSLGLGASLASQALRQPLLGDGSDIVTQRKLLIPFHIQPAHYVFAGVLLIRVVVLARLTVSPFLLPTRGDMHFYDDWARRIVSGQFTDHLAFYGLPGYAYLLAALYKLAGYGPFVPALLQALLDAGTAVLIYKISVAIFSGTGVRCAQIAGVVAARSEERRVGKGG